MPIDDVMPVERDEAPSNFRRLSAILDVYGFSVEEVMKITGKKMRKTVQAWFDNTGPVPDKAIRKIEKYVEARPKLRAVG